MFWRIMRAGLVVFPTMFLVFSIFPQTEMDESGISDPLLTAEEVADFPYKKPGVTFQQALKMAEKYLKDNRYN